MRKSLFLLLAMFTSWWSVSPGLAESVNCHFPITSPALAASSVLNLELPTSALSDLGGRLEALRIYDAHGREVPYWAVPISKTETAWRKVTCSAMSDRVKEEKDHSLTIDFSLTKDAPQPQGLTINTPLTNFERQVTVQGLMDDNWLTLIEDAFIFESSDTLRMRQCDVAFDSKNCRRFRVIIAQASLERRDQYQRITEVLAAGGQTKQSTTIRTGVTRQAFKINSITFWQQVPFDTRSEVKIVSVPAKSMETTADSKKQQTIYQLTPACYPVTGFEIISPEQNFRRTYIIKKEIENDFISLHQSSVTACNLPGITPIRPKSNIPAVIYSGQLQLILAEGDNPPLEVQQINLLTPAHRLYFIVAPEQMPCQLTAITEARAPKYQQPEILADILNNKVPTIAVSLGQRLGEALGPAKPLGEGLSRWYLLLGLTAFAIVLVIGVSKAAKSAQTVCSDDKIN